MRYTTNNLHFTRAACLAPLNYHPSRNSLVKRILAIVPIFIYFSSWTVQKKDGLVHSLTLLNVKPRVAGVKISAESDYLEGSAALRI